MGLCDSEGPEAVQIIAYHPSFLFRVTLVPLGLQGRMALLV